MANPPKRRLKHWGWGYEDQQPPRDEVVQAAGAIRTHLGFGEGDVESPVSLADIQLPVPRLEPPAALAPICRTDPYERASHALGKSYPAVVRGSRA